MKKGSKMTKQSRLKISLGLKKHFKRNNPWNKGLKTGQYDEPACVRLRRNPDYYKKELKENAIRYVRKKYRDNPESKELIKKHHHEMQSKTGVGRKPKKWTDEEEQYLEDNYEDTSVLELALTLQRSWVSVGHKLSRLGLRKYYKWTRV